MKKFCLLGLGALPAIGLGVFPFGLVLGVVSREAGFSAWDMFIHSALIFGGTAQITMVHLTELKASAWVIILSASVINARILLYSLSLSPYWQGINIQKRWLMAALITDQSYTLSLQAYQQKVVVQADEKFAYYMGFSIVFYVFWLLSTVLGNVLGNTIPKELEITFALPLTFVTLLVIFIDTKAKFISALVGGLLSITLYKLPNNIGFIIAVMMGIFCGTLYDIKKNNHWQK